MSCNTNYSKHISAEIEYHDKSARDIISTSKKDFIWQIPEKLIFIDQYFSKKKKRVMLDLGCGTAENIKRNVLPLLKKDDVYIGVDLSKKLLKIARKNVPGGIFINCPMRKVNLKRKINYLCFFGSLHHDENPEMTLIKLSKNLRAGGFIFMREPSDKAFTRGFGASPYEAGLGFKDLKRWLKKANCEIIEYHFLNTTLFRLSRKWLNKIGLHFWENFIFIWVLKTRIEILFEKFFPFSKGVDIFLVARKVK